jgi:hypothetical protein
VQASGREELAFAFEWAQPGPWWALALLPGLKSKLRFGGGDKVVEFVAPVGGTTGHVGFATPFASGDGAEVFDEVSGTMALVISVFPAKGTKVEFFAIVDDQEGGLGEVNLL